MVISIYSYPLMQSFYTFVNGVLGGDVEFVVVQGDLGSLDFSIQQSIRVCPKFKIMSEIF